jgi:hypothetical protein
MPDQEEQHHISQGVHPSSSPESSSGSSIATSFDELAKAMASGTVSRGKALRLMGSALLGAALASVPGVAWADDCRPYGRRCTGDRQCCSRRCIRNPRGDGRICGCPTGQTRCGDRCVNLQINENNCGRCGKRCAAGQECVNGMCESGGGCPDGRPPCGGAPTCCLPGETCLNGTCANFCTEELSCCCNCNYRHTTTGEQVSVCQGNAGGCSGDANVDWRNCGNVCEANTPPGTDLEPWSLGRIDPSSGSQPVCQPCVPGDTCDGSGTTCTGPGIPCAPPPA